MSGGGNGFFDNLKRQIIEEYDIDDDQTSAPNPSTTTTATLKSTSLPSLLPTTTPNKNALADDMVK